MVARINRLAERVRNRGGRVVFVQHERAPGDDFAPASPGWEILRGVRQESMDHVVRKTLNNAFRGTSLEPYLNEFGAERVLVFGWAVSSPRFETGWSCSFLVGLGGKYRMPDLCHRDSW